jgi:hypothetical protein
MEQSQTTLEYTREELVILGLLQHGRQSATSVDTLADYAGVSSLRVRQVVKHLTEEHGHLIVSSTGKPSGYFFPQDESEFKAGIKQYIHRIRSLARRIKAMDREAYEEIFGQSKFFED